MLIHGDHKEEIRWAIKKIIDSEDEAIVDEVLRDFIKELDFN